MAKKAKRNMAAQQAAAALAANQAAEAQTLKNNLSIDLKGNNTPDVVAVDSGIGDVALGEDSSTKRRRAGGALSTQLGINA